MKKPLLKPKLKLTKLLLKPMMKLTHLLKKLQISLQKVNGTMKIGKVEIGVKISKMLKLLWMPIRNYEMLLMLAWKKPSMNCQLLNRSLRNLRLQVLNKQTLMKLRQKSTLPSLILIMLKRNSRHWKQK